MLNDEDIKIYEEVTLMKLSPTDRYIEAKAKLEIAIRMLDDGHPLDYVVKISGLSKEEILNGR